MSLVEPLNTPDAIAPDERVGAAAQAVRDYDRVQAAIAFITNRAERQPSLDDVARHVNLSPFHFQRLFQRWAGLTPKAFLQAVTLDRAKRALLDGASTLDASLDAGLSGPGRLHDLFVAHEAMTPGAWKTGGDGLAMRYGYAPSPFGEAILVATDRGLAAVGWVDAKETAGAAADSGKHAGGQDGALADMRRRWPQATFAHDDAFAIALAPRVFDPARWDASEPLRVVLIGSDFEIRVWEALLQVRPGRTTSYGALAATLGAPKAARAVGAAVGRNPVSFVVPCHRVLGKSGGLTGYHWGVTRKQAILGWETGLAEAA